MKKIGGLVLSLFLTVGISSNVIAQTAQTILENVSKTIKTGTGLKSNFTFTMLNNDGKQNMSQSGTLMLKGDKYTVKMGEQEIYNDGTTMWTYLKAMNEVQIKNTAEAAQGMSPAKLFSGSYDKDFIYKLQGAEKYNGVDCHKISLTPKKPNQGFTTAVLYVSKANNVVQGGKLFTKGGTIDCKVSNINTNAKLADTEFKFNTSKYPKVETIDLR